MIICFLKVSWRQRFTVWRLVVVQGLAELSEIGGLRLKIAPTSSPAVAFRGNPRPKMGTSLWWVMVTNFVMVVMVRTCKGIICEEEIFPDSSELIDIGEENMDNCTCSSTKIHCPFLQLEILGSNEDNSPLSLQEALRAELR